MNLRYVPGRIKSFVKKHYLFIMLIILIGCFRSYLAITNGHLYWPDEERYHRSRKLVKRLNNRNYPNAASCLFQAHGRPGYVLISVIPAAVQHSIATAGIYASGSPHFFDIPSIFNVGVTLAISIIFYCILLSMVRNRWMSLFGTVVYSLLSNSNIYIRHLFPYDYSLLLFMFAVFLILRRNNTHDLNIRTAITCGILSALAFSTYPGYYLFVVIIAVLIFVSARKKIQVTALHLFSAGVILCLWEILSRLSGRSYLRNIFHLSGNKTQGTYQEGYIFAWRYLTNVEGLIGYALICLFFVYLIFFMFRSPTKIQIKIMFLAAIFSYLCYGTLSVVFHCTVFQGRIFHMYVPFLVWGAILALIHIHPRLLRKLLLISTAVLSLISFVGFYSRYIQLDYPRDFKFKFFDGVSFNKICNINEHRKNRSTDLAKYSIIFVNAAHLMGIPEKISSLKIPTDMRLVASAPHPLSFRAYPFEGYTDLDRKRLREAQYQMRIYRRGEERLGL